MICFHWRLCLSFWSTCVMVDLQLSVKSLPITSKAVSSNPAHGEVYSIQLLCDKVCQLLVTCRWPRDPFRIWKKSIFMYWFVLVVKRIYYINIVIFIVQNACNILLTTNTNQYINIDFFHILKGSRGQCALSFLCTEGLYQITFSVYWWHMPWHMSIKMINIISSENK
jgi:hypothetical protein